MATHAILLTWLDMVMPVLPDFIARAKGKYGANYSHLFFDEGDAVKQRLKEAVDAVPVAETLPNFYSADSDRQEEYPLKIFICGHGGTGLDYITDNTQTRKQTVEDLIDLLAHALKDRATEPAASRYNQVNMLACLFGRTPDRSARNSPAAKLHQGLAARKVYVTLVARTESIYCFAEGRRTASPYADKFEVPVYGKQPRLYLRKTAYTKMMYTFQGNSAVSMLATYDPNRPRTYVDLSTPYGEKWLWADWAVDQLLNYIRLKKSRAGDLTVPDSRQDELMKVVALYINSHNPSFFRLRLQILAEEFKTHRNPLSRAKASVTEKRGGEAKVPRTAQLIQELLAVYPPG
jgi:hypothetical protein